MQTAIKQTIPNPDGSYIRVLRQKLRANNGFCPTKLGKHPDHKCPCREYRTEDYCACGMYIEAPEGDLTIEQTSKE